MFLDRCLEFCIQGGTASIVLPQNWLFLTGYRKFREKLLQSDTWHLIVRMGEGAFESSAAAGAFVALITLSRGNAVEQSVDLLNSGEQESWIRGVDVSERNTAVEKATGLLTDEVRSVEQGRQLDNPDARVSFSKHREGQHISVIAECYQGLVTGDIERFTSKFWELASLGTDWVRFRRSNNVGSYYADVSEAIFWEQGGGELSRYAEDSREQLHDMHESGNRAWGKVGVAINRMRDLNVSPYWGEHFDNNVAVVYPKSKNVSISALFAFMKSPDFPTAIRELDQALKVTNKTLLKVPFDLDYWTEIAEEQYPNGLPQPYSNDPTQWIFHGHPCGSVIWNEETKWTTCGELRVDDSVLQVAVARLLGYRWPAELDLEMELAVEQREWVERCQELDAYADDDGIVCLPAVRGEKAADLRLEALLQAAYGEAWTTPLKNRLLETVGSSSLNLWLRDKFFEQHCKMFQHRPFIWHIWDGLKDGFSALANYHKLDKAGLERLLYTYLGDWIRTQQSGMANSEDGAQERLAAAEALKRELEAILEGEAPYDIFVRWKPLSEQPIGWTPDLNDGVRLNIRPFLNARDVSKKDAGILRWKPNIKWTKDRGADVETAPWYDLGLEYGGKQGDRINDHHLTLAEKRKARD